MLQGVNLHPPGGEKMKKLLVLGLLSLSAQAFSQTCEVDMVDRYNRVVRTFRAYGNDDSCIEGMKQCRKSIRLDYSSNPHYPNGSLDCVRAGGYNPTPNPNPYPNPNPNPYPNPNPNPYPTYGVTVSGIVEDNAFTFSARDASELYINCLTDIRRVIYGSSDELFFSVNNNRFVNAQTSGWYNDTQICSIIEQEARRSVMTNYTAPMRIVGSLERAPFQMEAFDRATLLNNCIAAFTATRQGSTDELTFSLNGAPFQRITTSGWWNTPARACKALIQNIDAIIR
jgi:hypothetical protein